jgi:hypothetical protein
MLDDIAVIIPVGPGETAWKALLTDLGSLPRNAEVLLVGVDAEPADFKCYTAITLPFGARWLQSHPGRGRQLNYGVNDSTCSFLWFLHADSRIDSVALETLDRALRESPNAIHHFDLAFQSDGPRLTGINAWGANFRSRFLHLPFGDQGFCLSRDIFCQLGRFDESVPYGEDHLFIWKAHCKRIPVRRVAAQISTSARKYNQDGWLRTTSVHLWRTARQALPQFAGLLMRREGS